MAGSFDPYREWLAITSGGERPNYYELLCIRPLESDIGKINAAFRRQSDRLAPHLSGAEAAMAQRLMTELTEARMTLLTPTTKRTYDQSLAGGRPTTTEQPTAAASKPARWRGSPAPESDDALLPPTAIPAATTASAMPNEVANMGAGPVRSDDPRLHQTPTGQAPVYPAAQPGIWQAGPAPVYPAWEGTNPGAAGQSPAYSGYAAPVGGYPAAVPSYPAQPNPTAGYAGQAGPQGYPPQGYAAQAPYAAAPLAAPTAVAEAAPQVSTFSAASYRAGRRRRSSSAPLVAGVLLAALAILGGVYWKVKSDRTLVATEQRTPDKAPAVSKRQPLANPSPKPVPSAPHTAETSTVPMKVVPPPPKPEKDPEMAESETPKSVMPQPESPTVAAPPKPVPDVPTKPDAPAKPDMPPPAPDVTASAEEVAAVSRALRAARAALAVRDLAIAQEQLDQATLEATAPDTLAQVERLELLTRYVEGFWEAARGTLGKLQVAEEIKIDDEVASVVEVSQEGLTLRVGGRNREYTLATLPPKIALYLARRWLAPDDPASDVAVAAFLMTDPKGDRQEARRLLQSAAAGGIDVKPLLAELDAEKK